MTRNKLRLAIVGAGPAGIYAADILLKAERNFDVSIDLFDHLPAPYGLVRYGVAPDHPRIKGIITALREVLDRGDIRIFGNVRFGEDITLEDLKKHYNAVIFATGAVRDASLNIPGIELGDPTAPPSSSAGTTGTPTTRAVAAGGEGGGRHRQRQRGARRVAHPREARRGPAADRDPRERRREASRRRPSPTCTCSAAAAPPR